MKCFTCDMTPSPCVPATCAAASCPASSGSSPKVFWARPNVKSRTMLTNGSSTTSWPSALASRAITMPFFRASSRLQVAANPIVDVMPVDHTLTEMPGGPSVKRSDGMPNRGTPGQVPAWPTPLGTASAPPWIRLIFSSRVSWLSSLSTFAFPVTTGGFAVCPVTTNPTAPSAATAMMLCRVFTWTSIEAPEYTTACGHGVFLSSFFAILAPWRETLFLVLQLETQRNIRLIELGNRTSGLGVLYCLLKRLFAGAGNFGLQLQMALGNLETVGQVMKRNRARRFQALRGQFRQPQLRRKRHGEAAGVRGRQQFLGVGALSLFKSRTERVGRTRKHAAGGRDLSLPRLQITAPLSVRYTFHDIRLWHWIPSIEFAGPAGGPIPFLGCSTGILGNKRIDSWPTAGLKNSSKPSAVCAGLPPPTPPPPCARRSPTASTWSPPKPPTSPPAWPPPKSSQTCCAPSTVSSKTPSNAIRNVGARTPSPGPSRISAIASRPPSCAAPSTFRWNPCGAGRRTPPDPSAAFACWPFPPAPTWPANRCCATWSTPSPNPPPPCAPTPPAPWPKCRATRAPCCSASRRALATPSPPSPVRSWNP